jgi:hypothetical protein
MIRKTLGALALAAFVIAYASPALAQTPSDYISPAEPASSHLVLGGCVIRFDTRSATGKSVVPRIHANSTHHCVGITSARADWSTGDLIITAGDSVVVTTIVGIEESFAKRNITCGPSGGGLTTRIQCYREGVKVPAYSLALYGPTMNLWLIYEWWRV